MKTSTKLLTRLLLLICIFGNNQLLAQTTNAGFTGHVLSEAGAPLPDATVTVKNESTGFRNTSRTNDKGVFLFKELPLGGPYTVTVSSIGFTEQVKSEFTLNQGDQVPVDFALKDASAKLESVTVVSSSLKSRIKEIGASTAVSSRTISRLPVNGRNFTSLIDLSPLSRGGNLSGQLASATNYTIDGMAARGTIAGGQPSGAYSISMEAIREFQIITNQYDVTYGAAGGGTISTVTKAGTNTLSGSAFNFARTNWLSSPYAINGNKRDRKFSTYQYGFSLGGPIIKDKAHFFVAWDHQADSRPLYIADIRTPADEKINNVTQSTLDQYLTIARNKYGVANSPQFGQFPKPKSTNALFARIDWQLNEKNLLTIRNNFINDMDHQSDDDNTAINLYEVYSSRKSFNNSIMASLRTVLSNKVTNELKVQHYYEWNKLLANPQLPGDNIPRAIVQNIESIRSDSSKLYTSIQLGGQRYGGDFFKNHVLQLTNNLYYNTNKLHFTFGGGVTYTNMYSIYGSEINGRFYFTGLNNFNNLTPYRYARDIYMGDDRSVGMKILSPNAYAQMQTTLSPGLDLTAGVRMDYSNYLTRANFNQAVYDNLGLRTDNKLATFQVQPRVQLTWDVNRNSRDIIRIGGGILGSALNPYSMINNMLFDGTHIVTVDISGNGVPTPDFPLYRQNPAAAPGVDLFKNAAIPKLVTINMNGKDAKVPVVYKMNASYSHFFSNRFRASINGYLSFGRNNYMYVDRNMVEQPYFSIAAEDNRGVYVPSATINATNGSADWTQGRKTTEVGRVLELISDGKVNQMAIVLDGEYRYFKDGSIAFSYTWNNSKDNTSYNGNVANTATLVLMVKDNPRDLSRMSYSDNQFRNKVVVYGTAPSFWGVSAGLRFSGISGTRYSMIVNGNVNGDFVATNDLAFVYDPNDVKTPQYLKDGINAILNNPNVEESAKKYIRKNLGKIAERNGGENPFYGTLDLRLSKRIKLYKKVYIEPSLEVFNVTNVLNKKWGVNHNLGNTSLFAIKSFNAVSNTYTYSVNTNAGVSSLSGNPYQFQAGVRMGF
jgi:hypothetical protein